MFIGLENINPDALKDARKGQNQITEYRAMLQAWHRVGALTYAGYILGFPGDTPASIERDIGIIQRELPIDLLEFFILTPLPGSADHKKLYLAGVEMEPDMNKYDVVHVTTRHATMSDEELPGHLPSGVGSVLLARARGNSAAPCASRGATIRTT